MATISSIGIGSGLDVNSIVSQLVALEKQPLKMLGLTATNVQAKISAFGVIQSQFATLTDVATRISDASTWTSRTASSSSASAATITANPTASAGTISLDVDQLATQQSVSSVGVAPGTMPGAGTLTLQLGSWSTLPTATFAPGAVAPVQVTIEALDTMATVAAKINAANAGVVASIFNDGAKDYLMLRSQSTGAATGFRVQSAALPSLVFDPQNSDGVGMSSAGLPIQYAQDAKARINGLAVTSASNTLSGNITGITINLLSTTTANYGLVTEVKSPLTLRISEDVTPAVKNVNDFVSAYNALNKTLADLTKYDAATKTAGLFQGDASVVGLQNVLRNMLGSASNLGGSSQRLSDVGLERKLDGSVVINTAKLSVAANNGVTLQQLFTANNGNTFTNGFALKFKSLGEGVAASGGSVTTKAQALRKSLDSNTKAQEKVNERATVVEARLRKQYSALDARMAQLTALNTYVAQQVTLWNKSTG